MDDNYAREIVCNRCKATYLNGTPHTCHHADEEKAHRRLELWLGEWTIEP